MVSRFPPPVLWSRVFQSRVFYPCIFDGPAFYSPAFSVAPRLGYFGYSGKTRLMIQIVFHKDTVITQSELHQYIGYIDGLGRRNPKLNRVPADYVEHIERERQRDPPL